MRLRQGIALGIGLSAIIAIVAILFVVGSTAPRPLPVPSDPVAAVSPASEPEPESGATTTGMPTEPEAALAAEPAEPAEPRPAPLAALPAIRGTVAPNDSMSQILTRAGIPGKTAHRIIKALGTQTDVTKIQPGQTYRIELGADGLARAFVLERSRETAIRVQRSEDGGFRAESVKAATQARVIDVAGRIESSLSAAVAASGEDAALVAVLVDVFAYDINFYVDTHKGDTFRAVVEKIYLDGEFLRYGHVLAAEYAGQVGTHRGFWWKAPGTKRGRYFDVKGRSIERTFLKSPLKFTRISSGFNPRRMHPVLHRVKGHFGTDYAAPTGTPVWAAAGGTIKFRGERGGAGNQVILQHPNGMETIYMHLSKFAGGQKVGQYVAQKTVIGYVGATGLATGPHLHFSVKLKGRYVDPQTIASVRGPGVEKKHRTQFRNQTAATIERLEAIAISDAADPGDR